MKNALCFTKKALFVFDTAQKMKFSIKDFFNKCDHILNGKLHFLYSATLCRSAGN